MSKNKDSETIKDLYSKIINESDSPDTILKKGLDMANSAGGTGEEPSANAPASLVDKYAFEKIDKQISGDQRKLGAFGKEVSEQQREYRKRTKHGLPVWGQRVLRDTINNAWLTQQKTGKQQGVLIYGDTGIGKTTTVKDWCSSRAKKLGLDKAPQKFGQNTAYLDLNKLSESQIDEILDQNDVSEYFVLINLNAKSFLPTDYEGVPIMDLNKPNGKIRDYLKQLKLDFIRFLSRPGARGVLFLDELNHAQVDVLNYMFNVIEEHLFGRTKISDDVLVLSAGNLGAGHGNVKPLPTGLKARFYKKGFLVLDPDDWYEFARGQGIDPRIVNYIKTNPYRLLGQEAEVDKYGRKLSDTRQLKAAERAKMESFATPRGVENFSKQFEILRDEFESAFIHNEPEEQRLQKGYRPKEELENWYDEVESEAKNALGPEWGEGFVKYLRTIDSFELGPLAREATSKVKSGTNMVRKFKSSETDQARLYALGDYLAKIVKNITDEMIKNGTPDPKDGSLIPAQPSQMDALRLQAVIEIINACKEEIQVQIIEDIKALPKINELSFKTFISQSKVLDKEIKQEFLEEVGPTYKRIIGGVLS
jgi:hypothetical protein